LWLVFQVLKLHILPMSNQTPYLETQQQVLAAALPNVAFDGWSDKLLQGAIASSGVDENMATLAFPKGVGGLIRVFSADGDARMLAALPDGDRLKIRERITEAVWTRLRVDAQHKEASRRAAGWLALPSRQKLGAKLLFETANQMWRWAGDTATDYNYYSKRVILSGVIATTRLTWFEDDSEDEAKTRAFLERRIENVMQFEKLKAKATTWSEKLHGDKAPFEGVLSSLAKMRYRS
jgi:ubiquinone biosynthesis protein COQ9